MKKSRIICILLAIIFVIWTLLVVFNYTKLFDFYIYNFIIQFRNNFLDSFFMLITKFGNNNVVFMIVFLFLIIKRNYSSFVLSFLAIISPAVMFIIKTLIARARPNILRIIEVGGYSFPSGHSMIAVCVYGYFIYYVFKNFNNLVLKYIVCSILLLLILLIGISRIYLGVHYPSDVVGGYLISSVILIIIINYSEKLRKED